jgi:hypothetical protein
MSSGLGSSNGISLSRQQQTSGSISPSTSTSSVVDLSKSRRQKNNHRSHSEKGKSLASHSQCHSDWTHIPVELFSAVLAECGLTELLAVAQVCSYWESMSRDSQLWRRLCHAHFGHSANLTEGAFAKLNHSWPEALRDWKDWFLFRRMFKREVAGSVHIDFVAYDCAGKTKLTNEKRSGFALDHWSGEYHCGPLQPVQKGVRDITFHFATPNTVIDIIVNRRSARFAKKQCVGRTALPLFALRSEVATLWLELRDVATELLSDDSIAEEALVERAAVRIALRVTLRPARYTVNDFEFVASVSHGTSAVGVSEMLFVRDRDTKKPYFMKIISSGGGPEWSQHRDAEGSSSEGDSTTGESESGAAEEAFTFTDSAYLERTGDASDDSREAVSLQWRLPSHPFLVDLFTSFRKGSTHYMLMEWVEGGELFSTAKRSAEGRFGEEQARFYVAEAVLALEHLHFHGIIYRDLRPENLLLDRKGHVKLTRPFRLSDAHERYSEFLAPEVLSGSLDSKAATANRVDWWSLGCIMYRFSILVLSLTSEGCRLQFSFDRYQMLVGVAPFSHPSVNVTAQRILHADYALPQGKFALSVPAADLLRGLLTK